MFPKVVAHRMQACLFAAAVAALLAISAHSSAQDHAQRLILKDGSYQLVTKYEVIGERVRYFSAERDEWEELPKSLVDWPATEKNEAEQHEQDRAAAESAVKLEKQIENENAAAAKLPEVAPGLRLPSDSGVFLLDNFKSQPQLIEVAEAEGDISQGSKGNIFRGALAKQAVELPGDHAKVQSHVDLPSFYLNLELPPAAAAPQQNPQSPEAVVPFDRFRIIRTQPKPGKRVLANVTRNVSGKVSQEQHFEKTTITRLNGGWLKLTPAASLAPGEYAVVEMVDKEGMNLYVWDFGINPNAPANANPWKPEAKEAPPAKKPNDQGR
ncbi:MAG TPA: hypothetical protein VKR60_14835 [Candidatus Sulfotelmatobacter sp.]|nr:hypothetical protein [Candidatus Sulfotelmatobacter sp.]